MATLDQRIKQDIPSSSLGYPSGGNVQNKSKFQKYILEKKFCDMHGDTEKVDKPSIAKLNFETEEQLMKLTLARVKQKARLSCGQLVLR